MKVAAFGALQNLVSLRCTLFMVTVREMEAEVVTFDFFFKNIFFSIG